jgi:tetratricopeptide (TPR) repeat protein
MNHCKIFLSLIPLISLILMAGCASPAPEPDLPDDPALARLTQAGWRAFEQNRIDAAIGIYEQALERSYVLDDPLEIGNAAYNLAVALMNLGEFERAHELLREADLELTRADQPLADVLLVKATLAYWQQQPEQALAHLEDLATDPRSRPAPFHHAQAALVRGKIAADQENLPTAARALENAKRFAPADPGSEFLARMDELNGRINLLQNRPLAAAEAFDREAEKWRTIRHFTDMVQALVRAAEAWNLAQNHGRSADRYFRAARSSFAQGQEQEALEYATLAATRAEQAGDQLLMQRIETLTQNWHPEGMGAPTEN